MPGCNPKGAFRSPSREKGTGAILPFGIPEPGPFRCFKTNPEIIGVAVMLYIRFLRSMRNVKDLLQGRSIVFGHGTVQS